MFKALIASLQQWCRTVEENTVSTVLMYSCIGYLTAFTIGLAVKTVMGGNIDIYRAILFIVATFLLGMIYYARIKMILDGSDDSD